MELIQVPLTPHEARQTPRRSRLQARLHEPRPGHLVDFHWLRNPLTSPALGVRPDLAFRQPQQFRVIRIEPGIAICSMRAARCVVGPTAV